MSTISNTPPLSSIQSNRIAWGILLVAIVGGLLLRTIAITNKRTISHDEAISYLAATANQGAYQKVQENMAYPYGAWVMASEWKTFFTMREPFAFQQIGRDLAETDIHPPLYFWSLHLWVMLVGVHAWTGPTLNLLLFLMSAVTLYNLARKLLLNDLEAAFVSSIWAVSPALIEITLDTRQYELLGLCTILFIWSLLRYVDAAFPHSWLRWLVLCFVVTAGALTHFHFALVVAGAVLIFLFPLYRSSFHRFIAALGALGIGYFLFFLLHPYFFDSIQSLAARQDEAAHYYWTALDFMRRIYATAFTYTRFWVYGNILQAAVFCFVASFIVWLGWVFLQNRTSLKEYIRQGNLVGVEAIYLFLWLAACTIFLYLALISPINAMTPRHMSAVWPFAAFIPVLLLRFVAKGRQGLQWLLVGTVFLSGVATVYLDYPGEKGTLALDHSDTVVVDIVHRGILPRIVRQLPDEAMVFAADQLYLLAQPEAWLPRLDQEALYISDLSYTNSQAAQEQILELVAESLAVEVEEAPGKFDGGTVYQWQATPP